MGYKTGWWPSCKKTCALLHDFKPNIFSCLTFTPSVNLARDRHLGMELSRAGRASLPSPGVTGTSALPNN